MQAEPSVVRAGATAGARLPQVVLLGGGFGGLYAARALRHAPIELTLIDRRNHHLFQPLLYQVATAALAAPDVAAPLRSVLRRQANVTVLLAEARAVAPDRRVVQLDHGQVPYDFLIVATGSTHAYFGHDEWARRAPGLKTIEDAFEIRRRVLLAFEAAEREAEVEHRRTQLTFVIVGAGPTGVELAGALSEIAQRTLARDFRHFDPRTARVLLLDAGDRVLPAYPPDVSRAACRLLEKRGVEVRTGCLVTGIDERGVTLGSERIEAATVLWAAGVQASPLARTLGAPLDRQGRVLVAPDLSVPGHPEIFVIGDLAAVRQDGEWVPGVAQAAIQEGRHTAANVARLVRGESTRPFRYNDKGTLATIGRSAAVAVIGRFHFAGRLAWVLWLGIHILNLIGFRNRYVVLFDWAWAYLTYERSARVILDRPMTPLETGASDEPEPSEPVQVGKP